MVPADANRVATAIVLHMAPSVTLDDGVESSSWTDRPVLTSAVAADALVDAVRQGVMRDYPRRDFDRRFVAAIRREAAIRPTCQSARLLKDTDLVGWMARSPWAGDGQRQP